MENNENELIEIPRHIEDNLTIWGFLLLMLVLPFVIILLHGQGIVMSLIYTVCAVAQVFVYNYIDKSTGTFSENLHKEIVTVKEAWEVVTEERVLSFVILAIAVLGIVVSLTPVFLMDESFASFFGVPAYGGGLIAFIIEAITVVLWLWTLYTLKGSDMFGREIILRIKHKDEFTVSSVG